ncbi:ABC transporter ATP-binding protein [Tomitella biformata]|uniref:ABC transporter ATP-binding protein n=1 Tax=Tomitella biformata TaxID=630403 RepID=UPI000465EA26|nr:ABC transporter ATP-binding protein [Tomitella biformata]
MTALAMEDVHKSFGRKRALRGCTFQIPQGSVTALVGMNGAGKSTLMSIAVGLLTADSGDIVVLGQTPGQSGISKGLSYLAQHKPLYPSFTVAETLRFGKETNPDWDQPYALSLIESANIAQDSKVKSLSPGQRARVALALALGRRPKLLLLDEPLADLDPIARRSIAGALMTDAAERGTTIVLSSHIIAELADVSDRILLLGAGRVRLSCSLDEVLADHHRLLGPANTEYTGSGAVVETRSGARQSTLLVQGPRPTPAEGWQIETPTLDDIIIAHLSAAELESK